MIDDRRRSTSVAVMRCPDGPVQEPATDAERIELFAIRSDLVQQSVSELRKDFSRMARHMRSMGFAEIPDSSLTGDALAVSLLTLLIRQASQARDSSVEHDLRILTGTRPWKI